MCVSKDYAGILRIGEKGRDASDKIRGFLYQDLLAIDLIMKSKEADRIYVEWIEDVFIENTDSITAYQIKHYPESKLELQEIYENMFYQYLKFKLYEEEKKEVKTYCIFHAKSYVNFDKAKTQSHIATENILEKINKSEIKNKLENCSNMEERIKLIFDKVASIKYLNEFNFQKQEREFIEDIRKTLKFELYNNIVTDINMFNMRNEEEIKDILLAVAIQYIQTSYHNKAENYKDRCMTKKSFLEYMDRIVGLDEHKTTERIKYIVLSYIDEFISEIYIEITDVKILNSYKQLYLSTKQYILIQLDTKEKRFKLLNSISTDKYDDLNIKNYMQNSKPEIDRFLEHKEKIKQFIKVTWKILFNLDCTEFSQYIKEDNDCFFFDFPQEKVSSVIILSPGDDSIRDANKTLPRITKMQSKPRKWYFKGKCKGLHEYSFMVNKITEAKVYDVEPSVFYKERDYFVIECMDCIKTDVEQMEKKDCDLNCFFDFKCKEG